MPNALFPDDPEFEKVYLAQRRRRRRLIVLFVVLPLMIPLLAILGLHVWGAYAVRAAYRDLAAKGYPTSLAALDEWYSIPEGPNAAQAFMTAIGLVQRPPTEETLAVASKEDGAWEGYDPAIWHESKPPLAEREQFTEEQLRTIDAVLRANAPAMQALETARQMSAPTRYPMSFRAGWLTAIVPAPGAAKELARIACLSARVHAQRGDATEAMRDVELAIAVTDSLRGTPILITQLVRVGMVQEIVNTVERLLNLDGDFSAEQLRTLRDALAELEDPDAMRTSMVGELLFAHSVFDGPISSLGGGGQLTFAYYVEVVTGLIHIDRLQHLNHMREVVDAASRESLAERVTLSQEVEAVNNLQRMLFISRSITPSLGRAALLDARGIIASRLAVVALSIEMFRKEHGRLPASLDELVPEFLVAVPMDPFSNQPMVYRTRGEGFLLYSVGEDGTGNQGAKTNAKGDEYEDGADIPFRVRWPVEEGGVGELE